MIKPKSSGYFTVSYWLFNKTITMMKFISFALVFNLMIAFQIHETLSNGNDMKNLDNSLF